MMLRARSVMRCLLAGLLLTIWSVAAVAADPLTLILLRMLRDHAVSSSIEAAIERGSQSASKKAEPLIFPPAPYDLGDDKLKALIDEGFVHLTSAQREEVFVSLKRALSDPKNAAARPVIIQELALKASVLRQAHEHLNNLSLGDKRNIAAQAREEYVKLPEEERLQMIRVLQSGIAPIPRDLNDLILAEFRSVMPASANAPQ
ncbi:MAG: hypothetical protein AABZ67_06150 [Pseudomonadota bacterium]